MTAAYTSNGHQLAAWHPGQLQADGRPVSALPQQQDSPGQARTAADKAGRWRGWLAAVPIVLVNAVAFAGQLAFLRVHLPWPLAGQVLVAVTLESVAVYLAWQAHLALVADDSALRLRLAAYAFALVIGVMNYSHYMAPHWRPTFAAVTFGLMSASSPWLWSVHSRRVSRDALKADNQIEAHAVRLGMTRWAWHPIKSYRVMRLATWKGENTPKAAIALFDDGRVRSGQPGKNGGEGTGLVGSTCVQVAAVTAPGQAVDKRVDKPGQRGPALDKAAAAIRRHPDWTDVALAKSAGVSTKTVQRARNGKTGSPA